jgi:oligopeptide/dipeptide ABC transporter ATP-binding protein
VIGWPGPKAGLVHVLKISDSSATLTWNEPGLRMAGSDEQEVLRVESLTVSLATDTASIRIVENVSFSLGHQRTLCVVGESGSGKTLTARAIMRLIDSPLSILPSTRILLEGRDLLTLDDAAMRRIRGAEIGMIFQEPMSFLNPVYTVGDQVTESLMLHAGLSRRSAVERTEELFGLVGIPSPARRMRQYAHELSGGMQQRAMISMALACQPKLLIADEPTTALDATIQAQILDLLRDLQQRLGMALLLITHDLGVVAEMATDVAVMYAGEIVESGPARDVLSAPRHPYTQALLRSIPRLGMRRERPLKVIQGIVPPPSLRGTGCRFASRCDHAFAACVEAPRLSGDRHRAACWLHARMRDPAGFVS